MKLLTSPESIKLRRGLIKDEEFWNWAQSQLPKDYDAQIIKNEWYNSYKLDQEVFKLLQELKGRYKLIVFSDNIESRIKYLDEKYNFRRLFDIEVYSHDHHLTKPNKNFIKIMIRESGCRPEELVYMDDNVAVLSSAKTFGVNVLKYSRKEIQKLRKRLHQLNVI